MKLSLLHKLLLEYDAENNIEDNHAILEFFNLGHLVGKEKIFQLYPLHKGDPPPRETTYIGGWQPVKTKEVTRWLSSYWSLGQNGATSLQWVATRKALEYDFGD